MESQRFSFDNAFLAPVSNILFPLWSSHCVPMGAQIVTLYCGGKETWSILFTSVLNLASLAIIPSRHSSLSASPHEGYLKIDTETAIQVQVLKLNHFLGVSYFKISLATFICFPQTPDSNFPAKDKSKSCLHLQCQQQKERQEKAVSCKVSCDIQWMAMTVNIWLRVTK